MASIEAISLFQDVLLSSLLAVDLQPLSQIFAKQLQILPKIFLYGEVIVLVSRLYWPCG